MKIKWCEVDTLKVHIGLFIGPKKQLKEWAEKELKPERLKLLQKALEEKDEFVEGSMYPLGGGGSIIHLSKFQEKVLIHEIAHAVNYIFFSKGIPLSSDTDEVYAYLFEHVYSKLFVK